MRLTKHNIGLLAVLGLLSIPGLSHAGGAVWGAKASGMGAAFAAIADDPSAIAFNPAGLTNLEGTNVYTGISVLTLSTEYENPSGESDDTDFRVFFPPHLYVASDLGKEDIAFGLGIYSPFGIGGRKWSEDGPTRYVSTMSDIMTISINPTIAYKALPYLSVGGGVSYMKAQSKGEKMVDQSSLSSGDGNISLEGEGDGFGYNLGFLLKPAERFNIGIVYKSGIETDMKGELTFKNISPAIQPLFGGPGFKTDASSTLDFPETWAFAIAYMPTDRLTIGLEADRIMWSSFDRVDIDIENEVPMAGLTDSSTEFDWKDIWYLEAGIEYKVSEGLALRGGYAYVQTYVPDHTLGPDNPDSNQHNFSVGVGYGSGNLVIDSFYIAGFFEDREVDNSVLSGEYQNMAHCLGVSVGYKF